MIQETTIEAQIAVIGRSDLAQNLKDFATAQPQLMDYLTTEDNGAFTVAEQELLFFGGLVIWRSILAEKGPKGQVDGKRISTLEEANFEYLQSQTVKGFRQRVTVFFEQSEEEELLAFIEDLLMDDETDGSVTNEGREPLFVSLKTVMDSLLEK